MFLEFLSREMAVRACDWRIDEMAQKKLNTSSPRGDTGSRGEEGNGHGKELDFLPEN